MFYFLVKLSPAGNEEYDPRADSKLSINEYVKLATQDAFKTFV